LLNFVTFIFVLGVLVFIHELGHFVVAKFVGVRVEEFSLGFGKKLIGVKRGDTEYRINLLPLGGYVKMAGDEPGEERKNAPDEFLSKSVKERSAVIFAGPFMNMVLAIMLMVLPYFIGISVEKYRTEPVKAYWVESESIAKKIGMHIGDTITKMNGTTIKNWDSYFDVLSTDKKITSVTVLRDGKIAHISIPQKIQEEEIKFHFQLGVHPYTEPKVGGLRVGMPAAEAGLKIGDVIKAVNDKPVLHWNEMATVISAKGGKEIILTVERDGKSLTVPITPKIENKGVENIAEIISVGVKPVERWSDVAATISAAGKKETILLTLKRKGKLFTLPITTDFEKIANNNFVGIISANGKAVTNWSELSGIVSSGDAENIVLKLKRKENVFEIYVTPKLDKNINKGFIGITPYHEKSTVKYSFLTSVEKGIHDFKHLTVATFGFLETLVRGERGAFKNLGGPIMIYQVTGVVAQSGFTQLLKFMGFLSLQLGILNLFPIPVLDGGHLFFNFIELIRKKPIAYRKQEIVQNIGMALLLVMIAAVSYNDILRTQVFQKCFSWFKGL